MSEQTPRDILGDEMTVDEQEILDLYRRAAALSAREDLAPCAVMNLRQAMVMLWNACNDLGLICEEPVADA